jgi:DNA segregation ATPase FtsK/SpoIIIE, S-DNA-T family
MRKRSKSKFSGVFNFKDERASKITGVIVLFIAVYFFIAFLSYLFTWQSDQDKVVFFSFYWLFQSGIEVSNWLGRLGAVISHAFFYWGFGISSFLLVYLLLIMANSLIRTKNIALYGHLIRNITLSIAFFAIFFAFVFETASFPWGGAFGAAISGWMINFIGYIGMIIFYFFFFIGLMTWVLNPNFNHFDLKSFFRKNNPTEPEPVVFAAHDNHQSQELEMEPSIVRENLFSSPLIEDENTPEIEFDEVIAPPVPKPVNMKPVQTNEQYDPTLDLSLYKFPGLDLLDENPDQKIEIDRVELENNKNQIIETLRNYKIEINKIRATIGPTVTLYEIVPAAGVRIARIKSLEDDIALSLAALGIRIIAPIPGKGTIGIEVPNNKKQTVYMREVLENVKFQSAPMDLPIALGKTISNDVLVADLAKMPHLLVAGATGQGKSVGINSILMSILFKKHPSQVKLVLIDPKKVELYPYAAISNHFLAFLPDQEEPITTETSRVISTLTSLCIEMDNRYDLLKKASSRNIREYNEKFVGRKLNPEKGHKFLPFIVVIIDEFADMIMTAGKEVEYPIGRLAQLSRAVGIHLIIATQRPSVNIITGVIKANFPARIAYKVSAKVDSRTILDAGGADQLIGQGDMLLSIGGNMVRLQGAYIDTPEVEKVIDHIQQQQAYPVPYYLPECPGDGQEGDSGDFKFGDLDEMFEDAARLVVTSKTGSTSMIQRRLKLGYNRAGRIMDQLEAIGIVGASDGSKSRQVLVQDEMELFRVLEQMKQN